MNRYYVIINGVSSLTIPGLAIKELPPITKTLMRNQREEIDGRDGDITTELGYSAYDKTMAIGLYGDYDINQIIAFFNQKGTIVFSDEADKYYNFTILERIDYAKLVKFRTASVKFHCQPFKYKLNETPQTITTELVESTGEEATLNNTAETSLQVGLKGNTYQETTTGKNLFSGYTKGIKIDNSNGSQYSDNTGASSDYIALDITGSNTYTISGLPTNLFNFVAAYNSSKQFLGRTSATAVSLRTLTASSFTSGTPQGTGNIAYIRVAIYENQTVSGTIDDVDNAKIQLEAGSATPYEPYTGGIPAPNPDYPQEVQVVTGENVIKICGKNLCPTDFNDWESGQYSTSGVKENAPQRLRLANLLPVKPSTAYYFDTNYSPYKLVVRTFDNNGNFVASRGSISNGETYTTENNEYFLGISIYNSSTETGESYSKYEELFENQSLKPFICLNALEDKTYTPYQSQEYAIDLGDLELCKIGTYQDYLYKSGGNWYKKCYVRKLELAIADMNNSESYPGWKNQSQLVEDYPNNNTQFHNLTDYFCNITTEANDGVSVNTLTTGTLWLTTTVFGLTQTQWKTNYADLVFTLCYGLQTPYDEPITDEALIAQLNALQNAMSYLDQTNVTQTYDNMPFILDLKAIKKGTNEITINNTGNIYSKPIMALNGSGMIEININDTEVLRVDMTEHHNIVIDSANMEAYSPDTMALRNRQVTGSYDNLKLNPGANTIKVLGQLIEATITDYTRWL